MIPAGNMAYWPQIACQRGHEKHQSQLINVTLGGNSGYHDLADVPDRLARRFKMHIWPPDIYPVDSGPYCPSHDAVSETIVSHHIWEPTSTIIALHVCETAPPESVMVDVGAQIGWFSMLALSCGLTVEAFEADLDNVGLLGQSAWVNAWGHRMHVYQERIGPDSPFRVAYPIRLLKADIEGSEDEAIRVFWPAIRSGLVDFILMEMSPVFADYYGDLAAEIVQLGYVPYRLPPKQRPPFPLEDFPRDMAAWEMTSQPAALAAEVNSWHQADMLFRRSGASW